MINDTKVIAIEGSFGVGKTTTALSLTATLKADGQLAGYCDESGRANPLVEDYTLHGVPLSIFTEVHLFCRSIADQSVAARYYDVLVCDKTPASLLGYSRVLLPEANGFALFHSMRNMLNSWVSAYDAVFFLTDTYDGCLDGDRLRRSVADHQQAVGDAIREELIAAGTKHFDVPRGLTLSERVSWIRKRCGALIG